MLCHKEWERPGEVKSSVSIPYEKVEEISRKLNVIVYRCMAKNQLPSYPPHQGLSVLNNTYPLPCLWHRQVKMELEADIEWKKNLILR